VRRVRSRGPGNFAIGLFALVGAVVALYFAFSREVPFVHHYTVKAVFASPNNLRVDSPVRIAGINVGKVSRVEPSKDGQATLVSMRLDKTALPLHTDAHVKMRPRIFLEGNFFLELQPGSPSAPLVHDGDTLPVTQTAGPVQIGDVLTSLQKDTRADLQTVLHELASALDKGGAQGYNDSIRWWAPAYRGTAIVNDASLGTREHDLSGYVAGGGGAAAALDRDPHALQALVANLDETAHALAVRDDALRDAIAELPRTLRAGLPALQALNASFPAVRRLVTALRPAVRTSGPALGASLPLTRELRGAVSASELRGLVGDLRPAVASLARLNRASTPLLTQTRLASSCQNEVILPWSQDKIVDRTFPAHGPVHQEFPKGLVGLSGESRSGDANGQWFRVSVASGDYAYAKGANEFYLADAPLIGSNPPPPPGRKRSALRPDVPCETQQPPNLNTIVAPPPAGGRAHVPASRQTALARYQARAVAWLRKAVRRQGLQDVVKVSSKPLTRAQLPLLSHQLLGRRPR